MDSGRSDEKVAPISVPGKFALMLAPGSLPPIGQHAISITYDQNLVTVR